MERLSNSVSLVTQLCKPISTGTPEDGDSTFTETLVRNCVTRYKAPEDIYNPQSMFLP
jgi:hypothetical protein